MPDAVSRPGGVDAEAERRRRGRVLLLLLALLFAVLLIFGLSLVRMSGA
ncbi:hypothetical protein [Rhizosaccharibacter radicis]|uniref:Uncharacterized protein n=1 Tax=Rhizosaccharibacter radicis TaxID=2782605 RepID=A0ABT1VX31_9PROT|nr:hypothetical protein [Acetobacteraceae bacterium KSS12]